MHYCLGHSVPVSRFCLLVCFPLRRAGRVNRAASPGRSAQVAECRDVDTAALAPAKQKAALTAMTANGDVIRIAATIDPALRRGPLLARRPKAPHLFIFHRVQTVKRASSSPRRLVRRVPMKGLN